MSESVCRVAVAAARYGFDRLYDYDIPQQWRAIVRPGMRVIVPFGQGNRTSEAIVVRMGCDPNEQFDRKEILQLLDQQPVLDAPLLRLAAHMCSTLFCTFYDCARTMLPVGLWFQKVERYALCDDVDEEKRALLCAEYPVLQAFSKRKRCVTTQELRKRFGEPLPLQQLETLCAHNVLLHTQAFDRRVSDKLVRMLALDMPEDEARARAERARSAVRLDVVQTLCHEGQMSRSDLKYMTGVSDSVLRAMLRDGMLREWNEEAFRLPEQEQIPERQDDTLSDAQNMVFQPMRQLLQSGKPEAALLYGVTGSGKTEVYLKLISCVLEQGRGAIMLVPEIGLTPQMIRKFMAQFGDGVAVLHSALSVGERYDSWKRIRSGAARVVVGTRSAVFAPVRALGLIILDEEQDDAYKSDNNPRYHARDIAKYRAMQENALVVFGSATPSVETFYGAQNGRYPMFTLSERYSGAKLPRVTIADMRGLTRQGYTSAIGPVLRDAMENCFAQGHQCILFLNRRGAARQLTCTACGWTPQCPSCSVSLTYHSVNHRLMCHYCGHSQPLTYVCPVCGSTHLKTEGIGTQQLERELHELFPEIGVLRMDADTTSAKHAHAKLLADFENGKAGILVGTQMVTKGLDFDNVALVGIIDADQALFAQDYRARERTFSLLTQVVGRAGRRQAQGHAVIQTYYPEHPVLLNAARQDYLRFYQSEIEVRRALQCPPAAQIVVLTASAQKERDVLEALVAVKTRLESLMAGQFADFRYPVLGPAPAPVVKVQNRFRYHLSIRCPNGKRRRELIGGILREFSASRKYRAVSLYADINPMQL